MINLTQNLIFEQLIPKTQRKTPIFEKLINSEEIEHLFGGDQFLVKS
ncbi:hypothetical protein M595_0761 [Lyngbya aestuarii BL J]|uniref:Uncharacterized protein n=1 Tax=Lyngbya aestuarii BL J TaxID=1348334 RepID=U7QMS1_9CYAN|nr:hypothetical protein M595_0761 [Lyngbya aestuarii BL J]